MLTFIQCTIQLLMDDELEVQQKAIKLVSKLNDMKTTYIPYCSQRLLIETFLKKSSLSKFENIAILLVLCISENKFSYHMPKNEYEVFLKNESNVVKESHIVQEVYKSFLRQFSFDNEKINNIIFRICEEMTKNFNRAEIAKFISEL
jgi:hypothetical protein